MRAAGCQAGDLVLRRVAAGEHGEDVVPGGEAVQGGEPGVAHHPVRDRRQPGACRASITSIYALVPCAARRRCHVKLTVSAHFFWGLLLWWQEEFLTKATPDKNLIRLLICMGEAMRTIAFKVRTASCGGTACVNSFGDEQLAVDMLADKLLFEVRRPRVLFSVYACTSRPVAVSHLACIYAGVGVLPCLQVRVL